MSTSNGTEWWDSIEVYSDDYVPASYSAGRSVETNHDLLKGLRENEFDIEDSAYNYGLLTLALVFLVAGLIACVCLPCCYQCLGKSRRERLQERIRTSERSGEGRRGFLMLVFSIMALASAAGAMWGLEKTDEGLTNIEDTTQQLADELLSIVALVDETSAALDDVSTSYDALLVDANECDPTGALEDLITSQGDFGVLLEDLQSELDTLSAEEVEDIGNSVERVSETVAATEGVRKGVVWPAIALCLLVIASFIILGLSAYGCIACGANPCGPLTCLILPGTVFLAIIVWLSAASAVTLSALSGDFCITPDANANEIIINNNPGDTVEELLAYYTGNCTTENTAVEIIASAQESAVEVIPVALPTLYNAVDFCPDLEESVVAIDNNMETAWNILDEAAVATSCGNINSLYQEAVYDQLCEKLPEGLLGLWVSGVFLTVLLLLLAVLWGLMLRTRRTDKDFEQVQANRRRASMTAWVSGRFNSHRSSAGAPPRSSARAPTNPSASGRYAAADPTTSGRFTSGRYPATTGRAPAPPMARKASTLPSAPPSGSYDATGFSGHNPPVQRPVVIENPQRPHRR